MITYRWRNLGPLSLVGFALLLNVAIALRPNPVIDLGSIDLTPGATARATFRPEYAERYAIGVRMNRRVAEHLYPCTVSTEGMLKPECKNPALRWPVNLSLKISSDGRDLSSEIEPETSLAGGEYEGTDTYTWVAAYMRPVPGTAYHLDVRSMGRASSLGIAQPHLVVSAASAPGLLEGNAIEQAAALVVGVLLVVGAGIWTAMSSHRRQPSAM
jgi:hypothetical protein